MSEPNQHRPATLSVHAGQTADPTTCSRSVPIYQTSSYVFENADHAAALFGLQQFGNIYTRLMNPTTDVLEKRVAALEGGAAALATASGQAAETLAILTLASAGDEIVSTTSLYGGTYNLFHYTLPKLGIKVRFVDADDLDGLRSAINDRTRAVYTESLGNPKLDVVDLEKLASIAHEHGLPLIVDNTVPSPILCNPIQWGADIVIHSATKFLGGHGNSIAGIIVDAGKFDWAKSGRFRDFVEPNPSYHGLSFTGAFANLAFILKARVEGLRDTGACLSPFNAFLILQGIETLHLRVPRHSENALAVAKFLEAHPAVEWVNYPGLAADRAHSSANKYLSHGLFGAMLNFGVKGGHNKALQVMDRLQLWLIVANVGDTRSMAIHPASTTHQQLSAEQQELAGAGGDLIRLSVGLEHPDDLWDDIEQALRDE